ncbi:MAG: M48 family metallopeptidase [Coriobacteriia bacterium]|nr:M48 family metallopeptidase [Coriobacteriia bacterium]
MHPGDYTLIRSKRKTLAIYIRDGNVEVRAPQRATSRQIENFLASKEAWIASKLAESAQRARQRDNFRLGYGDTVLYRGKHYPIAAQKGDFASFDGARFYVPTGLDSDGIKQACVQAYQEHSQFRIGTYSGYWTGSATVFAVVVIFVSIGLYSQYGDTQNLNGRKVWSNCYRASLLRGRRYLHSLLEQNFCANFLYKCGYCLLQ